MGNETYFSIWKIYFLKENLFLQYVELQSGCPFGGWVGSWVGGMAWIGGDSGVHGGAIARRVLWIDVTSDLRLPESVASA